MQCTMKRTGSPVDQVLYRQAMPSLAMQRREIAAHRVIPIDDSGLIVQEGR